MSRRARWIAWGVIFAGWTLGGLIYASHLYVYHALRGSPEGWTIQLAEAFAHVYLWAALTLVIVPLARRFRVDKRTWHRTLPLHLALGLAVSLLQLLLHTFVEQALIQNRLTVDALRSTFSIFFARTYYGGVLIYALVVLTTHAVAHYRDQEVRASELTARLAEAQLQALKMQLHPHFLFNTLHSISALMRENVESAQRMMASLSDLLRLTLATGEAQEVPLNKELEILDRYLDIEKTRFQDRLTLAVEVSPDARDALVPSLVLQPLVENAIRHGVAERRGRGRITVTARRDRGKLLLCVRDNGKGPRQDGGPMTQGIGLANTQARLAQLFGSDHRLEWGAAADGGFEVQMTIPFRRASNASAGETWHGEASHPDRG